MWDKLENEARFEIDQVRTLLDRYSVILDAADRGEDDDTTTVALGGVLHAFYNGVENVLLRIARHVDNLRTEGAAWHRELLDSMAEATPARPAAISHALRDKLAEFLRFRHRFRCSYSFDLRMDMMLPLARECRDVLRIFCNEIESFLDTAGEKPA